MRRGSRIPGTWRAALLALILMSGVRLHGQIFKIQGGDSTLYQAQGGSIEFKAPNYSGSLGAGLFDGHFQMGANFRTHFDGYTFTAGDDTIRFDLPTDIFDSDYFFSARGMGVSRGDKDRGFYAFGGLTSNWLGTGFFQSATAEDPVAILFYHRRLTETVRLYSRGIFSRHTTSLEAIEWQAEKWLKTSVTAGIGSSKGYFASAFDAETRKLSLRASYAVASEDFHRVMVPSVLNAESDKENIEVSYQPNSSLNLTAGHRNLLQPLTLNSAMIPASMNELGGNFNFGGNYLGGGFFTSSTEGRDTKGANLYAGHHFRERLDVTGNYFQSHTNDGTTSSMVTATFRETITPRFSLLQLVTRSQGQTTFAYGGQFITNRFNVRVDYQNVYLPLRPDKPFAQALALNAFVRLFGPVQINVGSSVAPDGHIRYTFGGTTYLYRYKGLFSSSQPGAADSYNFPKYVVQGVVRDDEGNPLAGAALKINGEVVYSDDSGRFLYRSSKHSSVKFQVVVDEFIVPGVYAVVQAPAVVVPEAEDSATDVFIVVRRSRTAPIELRQLTPGEHYEPAQPPAGNASPSPLR